MDNKKEIYKEYNAFICYRGKKGRDHYAPSEDVAALLWWWINHNTGSFFSPALFEECYTHNDLHFDEDGIKKFMPNMKTFFLVICKDFFIEIVDLYKTISETLHDQDAIAQNIIKQIEKNKSCNIYYYEIKAALQHSDTIPIIPILVSYKNQSPLPGDSEINEIIIKVFGEKIRDVFYSPNHQISFSYDSIKKDVENIAWSTMLNSGSLGQTIEKLEENSKELRNFKEEILARTNKYLNNKPLTSEERRTRCVNDLKSCATTIIAAKKPEIVRRVSNIQKDFKASNPNIIYDPVRIRHNNEQPPFLAKCMVDSFLTLRESCKLKTDDFGYWNVDLYEKQPVSSGISVCAVCFGTLILQHRLKRDSKVLSGTLKNDTEKLLLENIDAGVNLLIALRNPFTKTWPSQWVFDNNTIDIDGTVNQTTLSLSTLLSCGYLSVKDKEVLKQRSEFIWESVESLLEGGKEELDYNFLSHESWGYKIPLREGEHTAVAFTVFVFETLLKFKLNLQEMIQYFDSCDKEYASTLKYRLDDVDIHLRRIICYYDSMQNADGSFGRLNNRSNEQSITHTSYVIKSLYAYLKLKNIDQEIVETVNNVLKNAVDYLLKAAEAKNRSDLFYVSKHERFEMENANIEQYEHCTELIVAEALIKVIESNHKFKDKATKCLEWIIDNYLISNSASVTRDGNKIFLKGERPDALKYPIFYLYYYRMVLMDYLLLIDKKEESETV